MTISKFKSDLQNAKENLSNAIERRILCTRWLENRGVNTNSSQANIKRDDYLFDGLSLADIDDEEGSCFYELQLLIGKSLTNQFQIQIENRF